MGITKQPVVRKRLSADALKGKGVACGWLQCSLGYFMLMPEHETAQANDELGTVYPKSFGIAELMLERRLA